jgi:hypothetical protein
MARVARGLPTIVAATVGRIISRWSLQEALLRAILASAASVPVKIGRVAALEPTVENFGNVISDLLRLQGIHVRTNLNTLTSRLRKAKARRALLAHAVWVRHAESRQLGVQETRGTWSAERQARDASRVSKTMMPKFHPIDREYLRQTRRMIEEGIRASYQLNREIVAAQKVLRQTFLQQKFQGYPRERSAGTRRSRR